MSNALIRHHQIGHHQSTISLYDPLVLPNACGYLWNKKMVTQVNCRGYVVSQFMQPESSKYSHGPALEAKTFVQPEHPYFAHHPGRFFYIKDNDSNSIFSAPFEPMRVALDKFEFILSDSEICWQIEHLDLSIRIVMSLTQDDCIERWSIDIKNLASEPRSISVYPYFSIGYMSWMSQSATFDPELNAIVASSVTPYQKVEQYFENKNLKDKTFLASLNSPCGWLANQQLFEGGGGLHNPDALSYTQLSGKEARFETPVAIMQFNRKLAVGEGATEQFIFGPAQDEAEILSLRERFLSPTLSRQADKTYQKYVAQSKGCLSMKTDNGALDDFVNHWLVRQMFYHGDANRLSSDPQTRNYIQDNMGMCFIHPARAREAFILTLSQQLSNGAMPDGILLHEHAQLKYINQVPHSDHCVWLPICLSVYLNETGDVDFLYQRVKFADSDLPQSMIAHIELGLNWLLRERDERGLCYIAQGDWCDPMNMVGYQGRGVSSWLSLATAYALNCWCDLCEEYDIDVDPLILSNFRDQANALNKAVNEHLFIGQWYARGITDAGRVFGTADDTEGKIFVNPQSWAMLSGAAPKDEIPSLIEQVDKHLMTPFGVMMLAPSYTEMVEDIGRITQKHPGVSENGSVYNHAAIFYAFSLYQSHQYDAAYDVLIKMLPSIDRSLKTGQLPNFIPNYYRGAFHQFEEHAGRSSHLFNTGTISWFYRCIVEELCGLKGGAKGLTVAPKLPSCLEQISGQRVYRSATIHFEIVKEKALQDMQVILDGQAVSGNVLPALATGCTYHLMVKLP